MARKHDFIDRIDKFIGYKIYNLRTTMGLSRQQLSNALGVTHQQLQKYEKGTNRISAGRLVLIANALEKNVNYFYTGFEEKEEVNIVPEKETKLCLEVSRNFMKLRSPEHKTAVNTLIKSLVKESA